MGFLTGNDLSYYGGSEIFAGDGATVDFTLIQPIEDAYPSFYVYIDNNLLPETAYSYSNSVITFLNAPYDGAEILITLKDKKYGGYRYTSLKDVVNNFMVSYVGDGKIINRARRSDVLFHVKRALQEFSYDITKVEKIQEIEVGPTLSIPMPRDYVNYVSISYVDDYGIEHPIPRGRITSKPSEAIAQDDDYNYQYDHEDNLLKTSPVIDDRFKNFENGNLTDSYKDDYYHSNENLQNSLFQHGGKFGNDPELSNRNGFFIIDENKGTINFTSEYVGMLVTIKYISDAMGTDEEMKVHKLAEEAIYKYVAYAILSTMAQVPEYIVNRFKRERRSTMRNAKLRLYDLKLPELTQVMRGKSKQIKH